MPHHASVRTRYDVTLIFNVTRDTDRRLPCPPPGIILRELVGIELALEHLHVAGFQRRAHFRSHHALAWRLPQHRAFRDVACRETGCNGGSSARRPFRCARCSVAPGSPRARGRAAAAAARAQPRSRTPDRLSMQRRQRSSRSSTNERRGAVPSTPAHRRAMIAPRQIALRATISRAACNGCPPQRTLPADTARSCVKRTAHAQ